MKYLGLSAALNDTRIKALITTLVKQQSYRIGKDIYKGAFEVSINGVVFAIYINDNGLYSLAPVKIGTHVKTHKLVVHGTGIDRRVELSKQSLETMFRPCSDMESVFNEARLFETLSITKDIPLTNRIQAVFRID